MPLGEVVDIEPDRVFLQNLANGDYIEAQYNPAELEEAIGANYGKQKVVGLSHQVKQFIHTEDYTLNFTLKFDSNPGTEQHEANLTARKLLLAWCHPRGDANTIGRAGAPRLLFVWPSLISLTCVLTSVRIKHSRFNVLMNPTAFDATVTLEEIRDKLVLSDEVADKGTER